MRDSTSSKPDSDTKAGTGTAAKGAEPKTDASLSDEQLNEVTGGFNPKPDPPGRAHS